MTAYYNEWEPYPAQWLRNLIAAGLIAPGDVDTRSITEVTADDVRGYTQVHMFAGLGVWSYALRRAGWADDRPVWSGSCPCQPFSSAGRRQGFQDKRHLWPAWFKLIEVCRPGTIFGEQVSGKNGLTWLDLVQNQLEGSGYAVGALGVSAAGVGAPHIRRRLYFVADAAVCRRESCARNARVRFADDGPDTSAGLFSDSCESADACRNPDQQGRQGPGLQSEQRAGERPVGQAGEATGHCADAAGEQMGTAGQSWGEDAGTYADSGCSEQGRSTESGEAPSGWAHGGLAGCSDNPLRGFWADAEWLPTIDGRYMPTQRGLQPLALSYPGRVQQLRAYGNSLCAETAIEFVRAYMECKL